MSAGPFAVTRRAALAGGIAGLALAGLPLPARPAGPIPTPAQSEGPFYPVPISSRPQPDALNPPRKANPSIK